MLSVLKCIPILFILLLVFTVWGYSVSKWFCIKTEELSQQVLVGFFAYFIVMQLIIIPVVFLHNSMKLAATLVVIITVALTVFMLCKHRLGFVENVRHIKINFWLIACVLIMMGMAAIATLQNYVGYDNAYYIAEMNAFVTYKEFWTYDAIAGMAEASQMPLRYALSCFYPFFAILSYVFGVEARIIAMYLARSLCVILFGCTTICWGRVLFSGNKRRYIFSTICLALCMFAMDTHSSAFMMMVRGYESKGYCAAVITPMCVLALIELYRDVESQSSWRLLGLVAWASMPIAMSSMATIPLAIAIGGLVLMICNKKFYRIAIRCFICVFPNILWTLWYFVGSKL